MHARLQTIRVFDKDENDEWKLTCQWPAHKSVIWRVSNLLPFTGKRNAFCSSLLLYAYFDAQCRNAQVEWAHPEFGQVLASCSDDRTVMIWAEKEAGKQFQVCLHTPDCL
jgi:hypothetical protein